MQARDRSEIRRDGVDRNVDEGDRLKALRRDRDAARGPEGRRVEGDATRAVGDRRTSPPRRRLPPERTPRGWGFRSCVDDDDPEMRAEFPPREPAAKAVVAVGIEKPSRTTETLSGAVTVMRLAPAVPLGLVQVSSVGESTTTEEHGLSSMVIVVRASQ